MPTRSTKILSGLLLLVLVLGIVSWVLRRNPEKPPPSAPGYYTGPLRAKGNPGIAATEDGRPADLPPLSARETPAPAKSAESTKHKK